ncbi:ROK family protein [Nocardioides antri]|uniref:ROK family protein n=1 Tax=Nocardioides antri TaxID=2607659 RepID=A0A5B1MAK0_9ACTN|nr:ROK family protein [Nocardioides antri]KAA1428957.1 ROK family protein [Nocardioides antri]
MFVGVDVGGTKVLAVELNGRGEDLAVARAAQLPMPGRTAAAGEVEEAVAQAVLEVAAERPLTCVGVSAAGLVDRAGEQVRFAAHLPWRDAPVRLRLEERIGAPVLLDNDANCAARAELVAGALRGVDSAVLITVGTGIGGAVVLDGRVVRGANGMAGEFGHVQVVPDGLECECGLRGCWEQYCSGRALERVTRVTLGSHLDGPEVAALARDGHPAAREVFATIGTWLGVGIAGLVSAYDPEVVVVGGGVSAVGDLLLEPARRGLLDALQATAHRDVPRIVPTRFGPEAGAVGAALHAGA